MRLVVPVPEPQHIIVCKIEELAKFAALTMSIAENHVPATAVPLNHCFV